MGYRHSRDDILDAAMDAARSDGLSRLTFGRVAKRLGVSDRVVVYYFPSKQELIEAVLGALAEQLQAALGQAFTDPAADCVTLSRTAWPILATREFDPMFGLYFEACGLATAGIEPFRGLAGGLVNRLGRLALRLSGCRSVGAARRGRGHAGPAGRTAPAATVGRPRCRQPGGCPTRGGLSRPGSPRRCRGNYSDESDADEPESSDAESLDESEPAESASWSASADSLSAASDSGGAAASASEVVASVSSAASV